MPCSCGMSRRFQAWLFRVARSAFCRLNRIEGTAIRRNAFVTTASCRFLSMPVGNWASRIWRECRRACVRNWRRSRLQQPPWKARTCESSDGATRPPRSRSYGTACSVARLRLDCPGSTAVPRVADEERLRPPGHAEWLWRSAAAGLGQGATVPGDYPRPSTGPRVDHALPVDKT